MYKRPNPRQRKLRKKRKLSVQGNVQNSSSILPFETELHPSVKVYKLAQAPGDLSQPIATPPPATVAELHPSVKVYELAQAPGDLSQPSETPPPATVADLPSYPLFPANNKTNLEADSYLLSPSPSIAPANVVENSPTSPMDDLFLDADYESQEYKQNKQDDLQHSEIKDVTFSWKYNTMDIKKFEIPTVGGGNAHTCLTTFETRNGSYSNWNIPTCRSYISSVKLWYKNNKNYITLPQIITDPCNPQGNVQKSEWIQRITSIIQWEKESLGVLTMNKDVTKCITDELLDMAQIKHQKKTIEGNDVQQAHEPLEIERVNKNENIYRQAGIIIKKYESKYGNYKTWYNPSLRSCIGEIKKTLMNNSQNTTIMQPGCIFDEFAKYDHHNEEKNHLINRITLIKEWEKELNSIPKEHNVITTFQKNTTGSPDMIQKKTEQTNKRLTPQQRNKNNDNPTFPNNFDKKNFPKKWGNKRIAGQSLDLFDLRTMKTLIAEIQDFYLVHKSNYHFIPPCIVQSVPDKVNKKGIMDLLREIMEWEENFYSNQHVSTNLASTKYIFTTSVKEYHHTQKLPPQTVSVKGDGHCGYRALSYLLYKKEDYWRTVRSDMANFFTEMVNTPNNPWEVDVLKDRNFVHRTYERILCSDSQDYAKGKNWFFIPDCLCIASHLYQRVIIITAPSTTLMTVGVSMPPTIKNEPLVIHWETANHFSACTTLPTVLPPILPLCVFWIDSKKNDKKQTMETLFKSYMENM